MFSNVSMCTCVIKFAGIEMSKVRYLCCNEEKDVKQKMSYSFYKIVSNSQVCYYFKNPRGIVRSYYPHIERCGE